MAVPCALDDRRPDFDTCIERKMKPLVRLASCRRRSRPSRTRISTSGRLASEYNRIYTGWAYPPADYAKWGELVYQWARHTVERYGKRSCDLVLGSVERTGYRVLARHT
jgi:xylan 1,4-beta-xylosidase